MAVVLGATAELRLTREEESSLVLLLDRHYGDGSLYLGGELDRQYFHRALVLGLVSGEGFLTKSGWQFWRQRAK